MNPKQRNIIIICFLVMLVSFALIYLLIGPKLKTALDTQTQLQSDVTAKTARLDQINQLRVPLKSLEKTIADVQKVGLPQGNQIPDLIEQVDHIMLSQTDFKLVSFDPSLIKSATSTTPTSAPSGVSNVPFTLNVLGNPNKLSNLLGAISSNIRPMYVQGMTFSTSSNAGSPGDVLITLSVVAYNMPGASAATTTTTGASQ